MTKLSLEDIAISDVTRPGIRGARRIRIEFDLTPWEERDVILARSLPNIIYNMLQVPTAFIKKIQNDIQYERWITELTKNE